MLDPKLLGDLAKDHQKNIMTREEAKAFLADLQAVCHKHKVFLRTSDQQIHFSKAFSDATTKTMLGAVVDKDGKCATAKIVLK